MWHWSPRLLCKGHSKGWTKGILQFHALVTGAKLCTACICCRMLMETPANHIFTSMEKLPCWIQWGFISKVWMVKSKRLHSKHDPSLPGVLWFSCSTSLSHMYSSLQRFQENNLMDNLYSSIQPFPKPFPRFWFALTFILLLELLDCTQGYPELTIGPSLLTPPHSFLSSPQALLPGASNKRSSTTHYWKSWSHNSLWQNSDTNKSQTSH